MEGRLDVNTLRIRGGKPLIGELDVPGSKNSALAILSSVILCDGEVMLEHVPNVSDTLTKLELLRTFGVRTHWVEGSLLIDGSDLHRAEADPDAVARIRTGFYLLGPMLARLGAVRLPAPGGCKIGARPVDFHIKGLRLLGAEIELENGYYTARADKLVGAEIYLDFPSAGATQHLMSTATLAEGMTIIRNAAIEPEVVSLAEFLNRMGARIEGAGSGTITVVGVQRLEPCQFRIPADRLQAGTFLLAGAITQGDVTVHGIMPDNQTPVVNKLREAGAIVHEGPDWVRVSSVGRLDAIQVKTMPYPGFPTDMQQPMAAVLSLADGTSLIDETIYESRIGHISELNRMGARIQLQGRASVITGVERLKGAVVEASDLRAGAALCLAGLAAQGETTVRNVHYIDRGYENLEAILTGLGADVARFDANGKRVDPAQARPSIPR